MNDNVFCSIDLEMNQPSGRIIQIGACVGNLFTGEIFARFSQFVDPYEAIHEDITVLTGIGRNEMRGAVDLKEASMSFDSFCAVHGANQMALSWGFNDAAEINKQLGILSLFPKSYLNVKNLFQFYSVANNQTLRGGLHNSMRRLGFPPEGPAHRADYDALNTFRFAHFLTKKLREGK